MRVLALVTLPTLGAGNRLRIEQYAPSLALRGIELEVAPFFDDAAYEVLYRKRATLGKAIGTAHGIARRVRDLVHARRFDLAIVYREGAPLGPPLVERALVALGVPYVFDFDDAVFLRPIHPANRHWAWLRHPSRVSFAVRHAVSVIAGNDYLAGWAREWNPKVTVLATPVDTDRHVPAPDRHANDADVLLGWVGSSTTAPYLRTLDTPLELLAGRSDVRLRVIGGSYEHPRVRVENVPYDLASEAREVAGFDIGVLPEPDDPWTRGKGAFKALLYMAAGVPVVASDVGVNREVVGDGGIVVADAAEWADAIAALARDPAQRRRMGNAGRARVVQRYSLAAQAPRFAAVIEDAVARSR